MSNTSDAFMDDLSVDDGVMGFSSSGRRTGGVLGAEKGLEVARRLAALSGVFSGVEK